MTSRYVEIMVPLFRKEHSSVRNPWNYELAPHPWSYGLESLANVMGDIPFSGRPLEMTTLRPAVGSPYIHWDVVEGIEALAGMIRTQ